MKINISEPENSLSTESTTVTLSTSTVIGRPRAVGFKKITVGPDEPENPDIGDIWINTT